jgi:hypothetical protein
MSHADAFALKNSGFNDFLFAEVGNEVNGSPLTILSVLARLGKDPWTEAARLARLPKSSNIEDLANSISKMPLCPQALLDARGTAARLILLLPSQVQSISGGVSLPIAKSALSLWILLAGFLAIVVCGIVYQTITYQTNTPIAVTGTTTPVTAQMIAHPQASAK